MFILFDTNANYTLGNINYIANPNVHDFVTTTDRTFYLNTWQISLAPGATSIFFHGIFPDALWILDSSYTFACLK